MSKNSWKLGMAVGAIAGAVMLSHQAWAVDSLGLPKECQTAVITLDTDPPQAMPMLFKFLEKEGRPVSQIQRTGKGKAQVYEYPAKVELFSIRPGLVAESVPFERKANPPDLNWGESLVVEAMSSAATPKYGPLYSAGLELSRVRYARVFTVDMGNPHYVFAVVEAQDEAEQDLGSFLGGITLYPCQREEKSLTAH